MFHDNLLDQPRALTAEIKLDPQGRKHAALKIAQNVLLTMHYTEVLIEMAAKKYFPAHVLAPLHAQSKRSWIVLAVVEAIKAYCRLSMLYANRGRMLTPPTQEDMVCLRRTQSQSRACSLARSLARLRPHCHSLLPLTLMLTG